MVRSWARRSSFASGRERPLQHLVPKDLSDKVQRFEHLQRHNRSAGAEACQRAQRRASAVCAAEAETAAGAAKRRRKPKAPPVVKLMPHLQKAYENRPPRQPSFKRRSSIW